MPIPKKSYISSIVKNYSTAASSYKKNKLINPSDNERSNSIFSKDSVNETTQKSIKISFSSDAHNCKVFINRGFQGNLNIFINSSESIVYIGESCHLKNTNIYTQTDGSFVIVGNGVTTNGSNSWMTGLNAGNGKFGIIIGDDCMFSYKNEIRGSDAHPIFDTETGEQTNQTSGSVIIEPHVWIGANAIILKSTKIGSCAIIPAGLVCRNSIPKNSIATSTSPYFISNPKKVWSRSSSDIHKEEAFFFYRNSLANFD